MKHKDLLDIKALDAVSLLEKSKKLREDMAEMILDKNMNKVKDLKSVSRMRKDLAQILTIVRQKQLLNELEIKPLVKEDKGEDKVKEKEEDETKTKKKGAKK